MEVTTSWWLDRTPVEYVICDNLRTTVYGTFRIADTSRVDQVVITPYGVAQQESGAPITIRSRDLQRSGNTVRFSYDIRSGTTPFSVQDGSAELDSQAIVIVPTPSEDPASRQGSVRLRIDVYTDGSSSPYRFQSAGGTFDVWGGCDPQ